MNFEQKLRKILDEKRISQKELLQKIYSYLKENDPKYKSKTLNVEGGKGNFNKMIKGERRFDTDFIIPIEKILGIRYYDLINDTLESKYYFENKGIRYTAFCDSGYEKLLGDDLFILNTDEYEKTLVDYICEYNSKNGLKFLVEKLDLSLSMNYLSINFDDSIQGIYNLDSCVELIRMICENNNVNYFNMVLNVDSLFVYNDWALVNNDRVFQYILSSNHIISELSSIKPVTLEILNGERLLTNKKEKHYAYSPLLFKVIDYALSNIKKYKNEVEFILGKAVNGNDYIIHHLISAKLKYSIYDNKIKNGQTTYGNILTIDASKYENIPNEIMDLINKINKDAKLVERDIDLTDKNIEKMDKEEFLKLIYETSNIENRFRSNSISFDYIKKLVSGTNCEIFNLGDELYEYLLRRKSNLDKSQSDYEYRFQDISWGLIFIELYREKLNSITIK